MRFLQVCLLGMCLTGGLSAGIVALDPVTCESGSLQSYLDLPPGLGCSVDGFNFKNFAFNVRFLDAEGNTVEGPVNPGTHVATPGAIHITSPATLFSSLDFTSPDFLVLGGDRVVYDFLFSIDPRPPIMPGYAMTMDTLTPVFPGRAQATAFVCPDSTSLASQTSSEGPDNGLTTSATCQSSTETEEPATALVLHVFHNGLSEGNQLSDSGLFATPTNMMAILIELELDASQRDSEGNFGSSEITGVGGQVTPEPGTIAMLGAGLAALALLRRRR